MRLLMLIVALIVSGAAPAVAGPFEDGITAYKEGDYATARRLLRPLAEQGDARAQFSIGAMYTLGQGVPQDYAAAVSWYRKAAEQGEPSASLPSGMYADGKGVPLDNVRAHMWFNLSGAQGNADAAKERDIIAARMTPAQIGEAQKLAREWKPKR